MPLYLLKIACYAAIYCIHLHRWEELCALCSSSGERRFTLIIRSLNCWPWILTLHITVIAANVA